MAQRPTYRELEQRVRKLEEEALKEREAKYRELIENAAMGIYKVSQEGKFIMVNQKMATILGYRSPEEFLATVDNVSEIYVRPPKRGPGSSRSLALRDLLKEKCLSSREKTVRAFGLE
ncbi:MAG: PAS domain-containing protein [Pseudomonadota bacterium]